MIKLVLSLVGFLRFSELWDLKRADFILHNRHVSIFIAKSKTDIQKKVHWLHLAKLNSNVCPLELTKRYFVLAGIDKQCEKYIFRCIDNTKTGQKLRNIDKPISYTTVRGHVLGLQANIYIYRFTELWTSQLAIRWSFSSSKSFRKDSNKEKNYFHEYIESKLSVSRNPALQP